MRRAKRRITRQEYGAAAVLIVGLLVLVCQIDSLDNTLHGVQLFFVGCSAGILLGAVIGHRMNQQLRTAGLPTGDRLAALLVFTLGLGFGSAGVVSYWNIEGEQGPSEELSLPVFDKGIGGKRRNSHYVHVRWVDEDARLKVPESLYHEVKVGQYLNVRVSPGALGYAHVTAFIGVEPAA